MESVKGEVRDEMQKHVHCQVLFQVRESVKWAVYDRVEHQSWLQVAFQVHHKLKEQINGKR